MSTWLHNRTKVDAYNAVRELVVLAIALGIVIHWLARP
jgi:hypothetical protein